MASDEIDGVPPGRDEEAEIVVPSDPAPGGAPHEYVASGGAHEYVASDITVLEGLEAVRKRPGMYIGSTGPRGLHHLVWEVVDNSVDEAMAGRCDRIDVVLTADGGVRITDDGRGIPVLEHPTQKKSTLEVVMTVLHAGGKFDNQAYAVSGGLHGVGISVVNALSSRLVAEVKRDGHLWRQSYQRGVPDGPVSQVRPLAEGEGTGTTITFWADDTVFETTELNWETLVTRFRETAFLTAGLRITVTDEGVDPDEEEGPRHAEFHAEGGLSDFVAHLNATKKTEVQEEVIAFTGSEQHETEGMAEIDVAMQWTSEYHDSIHSFANTINTHEGGTHEEGFRAALTSVVNRMAKEAGILPTKGKDGIENLDAADIREGLTAVLSVKLGDPQFEGQTKTKLGNTHIRSFVQRTVNEHLKTWFEEHPNEGKRIFLKAVSSAQARMAARQARDLTRRKGLLDSTSLPGKLADCQSRNPEECEIFVVEGDSAGGTSKQARKREYQAILPIRGKILNVEKARITKILENKEIQALITAIGTGIGEEFDITKARYHKVVMLMDADVDGAHIRTLVLTFLFRYMRELIEAGYVYIAQPPLYQIKPKGSKSKKNMRYALNDAERDRIVAEMTNGEGRKVEIGRLKGLGEMDAEQLEVTTMDPRTRKMLQVSLQDAAAADQMFSILMGDDVEARRDFIVRNAKNVEFLDV
ncbi:DNA topoisomerase (ATP-hydrolyzing) subunit B [Euzebya sp.]|uniref:DNA topoisomerase (ATP-hydrolyzing) subunit B n=1 Tax=Euzebya sp. TaxID=1971409 RepID=UPI00351360AF